MQPAMNHPEKPSQDEAFSRERGNALCVVSTSGTEALLDRVIVTDNSLFADLRADWARLQTRVARSTVFMSWEWHYTWWQVYAGKRDHLHIVTWRRDGELVGLLPLYRQACGLIPGRVCLRLLGTGEPSIDEVATEYGDLLVDARVSAEIATLAADYLQQFEGWTQIEMSCLLGDSLLHGILLNDGNSHARVRSAGQRFRLTLDGSESDYLESLGASRAKRIRRSQRAAHKDGGLLATSVETPACFEEAFRELAELNHERQAHKKRKSVFASERFKQFHQQLSRQLFDTGAVDIVRFHVADRLMAVLYCFYDADTCYYYQSGFTRKDSNRYMPLTLAHLMEMQRNREAGRQYYDFMRGEASTYKEEFNCDTSPMVDVSVYRWQGQMSLAVAYCRLRKRAGAFLRQFL